MSTLRDETDRATVAARAGLKSIPEQIDDYALVSAAIHVVDTPDWLLEIVWENASDRFRLQRGAWAGADSEETGTDKFGVGFRESVKDGVLTAWTASDPDQLQRFEEALRSFGS